MDPYKLAEMLFGAFGIVVAVIGLAIQVAVGVIIAYYTVETQKLRKASERQNRLVETRQLLDQAPCYFLKDITPRRNIRGHLGITAELQVLVDKPAFDVALVCYCDAEEGFVHIHRGCLHRRHEGDVMLDGESEVYPNIECIAPFIKVYSVEPEVILSKVEEDGSKVFLLFCDAHRNVFIEEFIQDAKDGASYRLDKFQCLSSIS